MCPSCKCQKCYEIKKTLKLDAEINFTRFLIETSFMYNLFTDSCIYISYCENYQVP